MFQSIDLEKMPDTDVSSMFTISLDSESYMPYFIEM